MWETEMVFDGLRSKRKRTRTQKEWSEPKLGSPEDPHIYGYVLW